MGRVFSVRGSCARADLLLGGGARRIASASLHIFCHSCYSCSLGESSEPVRQKKGKHGKGCNVQEGSVLKPALLRHRFALSQRRTMNPNENDQTALAQATVAFAVPAACLEKGAIWFDLRG